LLDLRSIWLPKRVDVLEAEALRARRQLRRKVFFKINSLSCLNLIDWGQVSRVEVWEDLAGTRGGGDFNFDLLVALRRQDTIDLRLLKRNVGFAGHGWPADVVFKLVSQCFSEHVI
jgi:hypothetical protein